MFNPRCLLLAFAVGLLLAGGPLAFAEPVATTNGSATEAVASDLDHQAMRELIPIYEQTASEGKPKLLQPYLAPDFSGVMVTGDSVGGTRSLQDYWAMMQQNIGAGGSYRVKVNLAGPASIAGDMAVAYGTTDDVVTRSGKEYRFQGQWTAVLRKIEGRWKVQRVHASMYPISNPFVGELVRGTGILWGAVAGIVGILVGWLLHKLLARGRKTPAATA